MTESFFTYPELDKDTTWFTTLYYEQFFYRTNISVFSLTTASADTPPPGQLLSW